jgi:hypothetical protein
VAIHFLQGADSMKSSCRLRHGCCVSIFRIIIAVLCFCLIHSVPGIAVVQSRNSLRMNIRILTTN